MQLLFNIGQPIPWEVDSALLVTVSNNVSSTKAHSFHGANKKATYILLCKAWSMEDQMYRIYGNCHLRLSILYNCILSWK